MILNAFSIAAAFAALLRVVLGVAVVAASAGALRSRPPEGEERYYVAFVLGAALVGLVVVSWPLLYLVLQSFVPEWPGVMCIQGVTRIGTGSVGASAHLPGLVDLLEIGRPALVFMAGTWVVLHLASRRGGPERLRIAMLATLLACGLGAAVDGAAELAYLVIPKKEEFLASGCCTSIASTFDRARGPPFARPGVEGFAAAGLEEGGSAHFLVGGATLLGLTMALRRIRERRSAGAWLAIALLGAAASLPVGLAFLQHVAAPAFLRLPFHACAYCLLASAPESFAGIAAHLLGAFAVGWACVAFVMRAAGGGIGVSLLQGARFGYCAALLMAAVRMAIR